MNKIFAPILGLLALGFVHASSAVVLSYSTTLNGANEAPPNASPASGFATLSWDTIAQTLTVDINFTGLLAPATAAHIHCCAAAGVNAGVAVGLTGFPAANSGVYNQVFDLTDSGIYNGTFLTSNGGSAAGAEAALFSAFSNQLAYINIHTSVFPGGEIRGQIVANAVPEPTSLLLMSMGLLGFSLLRSRSRQSLAPSRF